MRVETDLSGKRFVEFKVGRMAFGFTSMPTTYTLYVTADNGRGDEVEIDATMSREQLRELWDVLGEVLEQNEKAASVVGTGRR